MTASAKRTITIAAALGGAALLLLSLFLEWYEVKSSVSLGEGIADSIGFSGWTALEFADGFLLFAALAAAWLAFARLRAPSEDPQPLLLGLGLATTAVVLVLFFTKNSVLAMLTAAIDLAEQQPGAESVPVEVSTKLGAILALLGSLALAAAGLIDSLIKPRAAAAAAGPGYGTPATHGTPGAAASPAAGAQQATAPGWYPDPHGQARERYWDGSQWTGHTR